METGYRNFREGRLWGFSFSRMASSQVAVNKLQYVLPAAAGSPAMAQWNQRPQDMLNFVDWMGRQLEHRINWQVVKLTSTSQTLHEAPILFISGSQALNFADDDVARLRQFIEDGGMIVGNADCGNEAFSKGFVELGKRMFPAYAFRELPGAHPIYTNEQYRAGKLKHPPGVQGLSNGVRVIDAAPIRTILSRTFQHRNDATQADPLSSLRRHRSQLDGHFGVGAEGGELPGGGQPQSAGRNARSSSPVFNTTGTGILSRAVWRRGAAQRSENCAASRDRQARRWKVHDAARPTEASPAPPSETAIRQMAIKRIAPADLQAAMLEAPEKLDALVKARILEIHAELDAAEAARKAGSVNYPIAHLTGTGTLKLSEAQRQELKKYVDAGGTLIIDAAGGSTEFAASVEQALNDLFGAARHGT